MVGIFQSFRSSSMPKRLLRYALSRLELLDSDALDLENLDLALGRNTVFEFRDVGIRLKKLEELLKLPEAFSLQRAKVLLLRVSIPMDFYTSPITIDIEGVDVRLKVIGADKLNKAKATAAKPSQDATLVPNTVDLAQSFLETQSSAERRKLEEALAAETQDLVASSATISDDGSEEEPAVGTGQPLSLPTFLANFLQGILDRMQIRIMGVAFQLDMDVPVELNSPNTEPVSFQIALQDIDIEGVTTMQAADVADPSALAHKEGKRQISLANIRAYLISEAKVIPALTRSSSTASPFLGSTSPPPVTRASPSRQTSAFSPEDFFAQDLAASQGSLAGSVLAEPLGASDDAVHEESMQASIADLRLQLLDSPQQYPGEHPTDLEDLYEPQYPSGDSEEALGIPYDLSEQHDGEEEDIEGPSTPRAAAFRARQDEGPLLPPLEALETELPRSGILEPRSPSASVHTIVAREPEPPASDNEDNQESAASSQSPGSQGSCADDLAQSHVYTHEEAESMYMSAFTGLGQPLSPESSQSLHPDRSPTLQLSTQQSWLAQSRPSLRSAMPGGWDDDNNRLFRHERLANRPRRPGDLIDDNESTGSSPAFSRANLTDLNPDEGAGSDDGSLQDDASTPRGPPRIAKEIFHLQHISIYIPSQREEVDMADSVAELARSMGASVQPQAPGAFSVSPSPPASTQEPEQAPGAAQALDNATEVYLSPVSVRFDASIAFLLAMIVSKLLEAVKDDGPTAPPPPPPPPPPRKSVESRGDKKSPELEVRIQEISVDFVNLLAGVADTTQRHLDPTAFVSEHKVLLNATFGGLAVSVSPTETTASDPRRGEAAKQSATLTKIDLQRFRFGYANGDILSFDKAKPVSTSVRDTFLSNGNDIAIKMTQTKEMTRTEIETLPLALQIDLQRLDETFNWFGGLGSFLNMSASMTSSPVPTPKPTPRRPTKAKGVRFDTPINPEDKSAASENKVNLRIGGAFVELLGKECSVVAETNAIKLVSRDEGIGMACSMMRLSGPLLSGSSADPAITAEIGGVRLDFLSSPKDGDLEKLLELITPSKAKFDRGDDEIMVDTLLRQRRKGSVLRTNIDSVQVRVKNMAQLAALPGLAEEMAKLATVAKYLPEDDRPGLLTLAKIQKIAASVQVGGTFGHLSGELNQVEVGHISVPSLVALAVSGLSLRRNQTEELISSSALFSTAEIASRGPVVMARMIGDEIEPVIKLRFQDINIEYRVPTIMDFLGLGSDATPQDFEESLAASVANLGDQAHTALARQPSSTTEEASKQAKPMTLDVAFRDCLIGLNPMRLKSKMVLALTDAGVEVVLPKDDETAAALNLRKASILLTDDASQGRSEALLAGSRRRSSSVASPQMVELSARGYVDICFISSAKVSVNVAPGEDGEKQVEVEVRDDLLVLETCADSLQTLISLANALSPPTPPSKENKYRTNVVPVQDLLASISAEAFGRPEGEYDFDQDFAGAQEMAGSGSESHRPRLATENSLRIESQFYGEENDVRGEELFDATRLSGSVGQDTREGLLITSPAASYTIDSDGLSIHDSYFAGSEVEPLPAKVWNSVTNSHDRAPPELVKQSPLKVSVKDVHVIWNLFDGFDWAHTRDVISKAVQDVEAKAYERQARLSGAQGYDEEFEDEETIGDFLFNSIYIGIPANRDPHDLSRAINEGLHDNATETESIAPSSTITAATNRTTRRVKPKSRPLKLHRSKHHKITFELQGVSLDLVSYPAGACETQSSIDVKVNNLDIFDHVPTSTWKKFATYDQDQGEREMGRSMVHLELLNVRPLPELGASEIVMRASVLPLRLHVDQDALDFITRYFEFKDDSVLVHTSPSDVPFLQRAEIFDIGVKLDFKPKRVDYAGLRSGHTTEFMNFITLEESRMVLRHVIIYGVSGFERLGRTVQDIWTPDVRNNQLPGVIAGLAPVRSLVNIGSGFRDLVEIPLNEYKKDGRVIRSISKGAMAFARTTGTELVKFGAKLAVGTQYALQGAEEMLSDQQQREVHWDEDDLEPEERKQISLYADQPTGVIQGIRGGYRSLARDVNLARDAIIAVPGEVMESSSPAGAAKAVLRRAPTIIFRPAVGVTRAIGQTLMGATNSMDPDNQRRIDEKYKKH
ncbi:Autophagy-related protein 2 [Escovopsis weberi]|uniref:Autophagy-related protein 2 n=1 Tax=Escovopsis weberi TaxID=150374 RepID=A0A0M8N8T9_ESCWE|nr:Autophagy-related protein 2 [Escovopsis weberi]